MRSPTVGMYYIRGRILPISLFARFREWSEDQVREIWGTLTRPPLFSTHTAFFLWSMQSSPATTVTIVSGGVWRRPGPSFKGTDGLEEVGRAPGGIGSPGRTSGENVMANGLTGDV